MFQKLEVGNPFPFRSPSGGDAVLSHIVGESFDVICWASGLSSFEVKQWRKGRLHYGVFIQDDIPFFLVEFPVAKWNFDVSIDILAEKERGRDYETFLNGQGNMVNFFLVDAITNNIKAMRMIGIAHETATEIKTACRNQLFRYRDSQALGFRLSQIMAIYDTNAMIRASHMIQHQAT